MGSTSTYQEKKKKTTTHSSLTGNTGPCKFPTKSQLSSMKTVSLLRTSTSSLHRNISTLSLSLSHLSHLRKSLVEDGDTSPAMLSVHQDDRFDCCSTIPFPCTLLKLGLLSLSPPHPSGTGNDSRFLAVPGLSLSGVDGLCFGALCDLTRAFADSVAAM